MPGRHGPWNFMEHQMTQRRPNLDPGPSLPEIGPTLAQHWPQHSLQSAQFGPDMTQERRVHLGLSAKAQMNTPFLTQHSPNIIEGVNSIEGVHST